MPTALLFSLLTHTGKTVFHVGFFPFSYHTNLGFVSGRSRTLSADEAFGENYLGGATKLCVHVEVCGGA